MSVRPAAMAAFDPVKDWFSLNADILVHRAEGRYGGHEFVAPNIHDALRRLTESLETSAALSARGRVLTHFDLLRLLDNALKLQQIRLSRVSTAFEPIVSPLVITGLPRSGSTFLHRLLAEDPANRVLRHWEVMRPAQAVLGAPDLRLKTRAELVLARLLAPGLASVHPMTPNSPQECTELMSICLMSLRFDSTYDVPGYRSWLDQNGVRAAYLFHKRVLQMLQTQRHAVGAQVPRWILKSPDHIFALPSLFAVYPDARLILTHRDPVQVLASQANLTCTLRGMFSNAVNPRRIGAQELERWSHGADLMVQAASRHNSLTLSHRDIVRHPLETVRRIYRVHRMELSLEAQRRMEQFVRMHPRGDYGRNSYELIDYGYSVPAIADRFVAHNVCMSRHIV